MNHKFRKPLILAGLCLLLAVLLPDSALAQDADPPLPPTPEPEDELPQAPLPDDRVSEINAEGFEAADMLVIQSLGATTRVSLDSLGAQANADSGKTSISADGRYVAFHSDASNLVSGDTNGFIDVFVHDRQTGQTTRVSVDSLGTQANSDSSGPSISADGRFVAFYSYASNLVNADTNGYADIFVHDRSTGATTRVSLHSDGTQGTGHSYYASISADGRYVAFESYAGNLVSADTNGKEDIFVHDRSTGATTRVSLATGGAQTNGGYDPSISADGRYVAFHSSASNLVVGDTNNEVDIFVHDRSTGTTTRVSVDSLGAQANDDSYYPSISADGRYVTFYSTASNLVVGDTNNKVDIFVHDCSTGATTCVSLHSDSTQANNASIDPFISSDGRYVAFVSWASNLVSGDTNGYADIFVRDRWVRQTVTFTSNGTYDGWVLESARTSSKGGSLNKTAATLSVGDDAKNRQYRSILHFNTASLPDTAVITAVKLQVRRAGIKGTNPFKTHGALYVDLRKGAFSNKILLQAADWQAAASKLAAGKIPKTSASNWHTLNLAAANLKYINKKGVSQLRLRFAKQDNGDNGNDYVNFYSGNAGAAKCPKLIITYYVP